jgi:hypothetical protein
MTHRRFRVGRGGSRRVPRGSAFRFRLSRPAIVTIAIERLVPGRRVVPACRPSLRALRHRRRCTRTLPRGALTVTAHAGGSTVRFSGHVRGRRLPPGRYRARLRAHAADGTRSGPAIVTFTIAPG